MFTGIVQSTATIAGVSDGPGFRRLTIAAEFPDLKIGQSIAVNGCCLTAISIGTLEVGFDVVRETLEKTNLGMLGVGDRVNIEQSLKAGDRLDGHFVQGHVDGRALLVEISNDSGEYRLRIEAPLNVARYLIPKGSVTLDGVSLTIAATQGSIFEVALIPETLKVTTLGEKRIGWPFNMEADILSKTVIAWLERQRSDATSPTSARPGSP